MTRKRLALAGAVAALAATASLLGGMFSEPGESRSAVTSVPVTQVVVDRAFSGLSLGNTARAVTGLQERLRARPGDVGSMALLGLAFQQRARETGDPAYYPRSGRLLRRALSLAPRNELAMSGLASLALSQHRFRDALALGRRAQALAPGLARSYGLVGDALVELGRYDEAFAAFDRMARLKPNLASYARVSYGRELIGRRAAAVDAMRLGVKAAGAQAEPAAWARVQLAKLHFGRGELTPAARELRRALRIFPAYVYALDELARVEAARGRFGRAIELARQAAETVPLPEFVATLGDLYRATGQEGRAREQYALLELTERLLKANGVRTDLELALFKLDHGIELRHALEQARAARRARPTVFADDALAWALARNGRCAEALRYSKQSMRLGIQEAAFFFHRGMIERCLDHRAEARRWFARALDQNPYFSLLWAPIARKALR